MFAGDMLAPVGHSHSTVLADMDFETYSDAGYVYHRDIQKWKLIKSARKGSHGLEAVGVPNYAEHPSTEVLSLAYDLKDGRGERLWIPGMEPPQDLFDHIASGQLIEAWNVAFEWYIWNKVCVRKMGWPELPMENLRCAMAKARGYALPGGLGQAAKAVNAPHQKLKSGTELLNFFSKPRNPTKSDSNLRNFPMQHLAKANRLYTYCRQDIRAEAGVSGLSPDLPADELELWKLDQKINRRGVAVDVDSINILAEFTNRALDDYNARIQEITYGMVSAITELKKLSDWMAVVGERPASLKEEAIIELLERPDIPLYVREALELRQKGGSAAVKKLFALQRQMSPDGRMRELFAYCGADRTGRFAGRGPQPQNFPNDGPKVKRCECGKHYGLHLDHCPWCGAIEAFAETSKWSVESCNDALEVANNYTFEEFKQCWGDPLPAISGCLRALFMAEAGKVFMCSDYSAIEAVVLAQLAGEQWRIDLFNGHGMIYEMSASQISGIPFQEFLDHKERTGQDHPLRKSLGKIAELGSGYQGSVGAWKNFDADKYFDSDEQILEKVRAWRAANPNIVKFWYGLQDAAHSAVQNPGQAYSYRDITYQVARNVLYCKLPSGRMLCYHNPALEIDTTPWGKVVNKLTYWGRDSETGAWVKLDTYGGKLVENVTQAVARDILVFAMKNLERAGYHIVLHVHDEIVAEVPEGFGSIEEFEAIMATLPDWCEDWPIKAAGGWVGPRYRKD